jgi:hypothetical protein
MSSNGNRRAERQVRSITGRDGYLQMQALAYAITAIELRPPKYQEWSNKEGMKLLLEHFCFAPLLRQALLDGAKAHLTGIGHGSVIDHVPYVRPVVNLDA